MKHLPFHLLLHSLTIVISAFYASIYEPSDKKLKLKDFFVKKFKNSENLGSILEQRSKFPMKIDVIRGI